MPTKVEKKVPKRETLERHAKVAMRFRLWLDKNPHALLKKRIRVFDEIADEEYDK